MTAQTSLNRPKSCLATIFVAAVSMLPFGIASAANENIEAPNVVPITKYIVTSGQPTKAALGRLREQGYGAVIYLAPPTVADAVPEEAEIVRQQGLEFVNIPIEFGNPTGADFDEFIRVMQTFRDRKVLVHCQVNMRASTMTFLYRVIVGKEKPELAYDSVARVWSPRGAWKQLIVAELHKATINFEPY